LHGSIYLFKFKFIILFHRENLLETIIAARKIPFRKVLLFVTLGFEKSKKARDKRNICRLSLAFRGSNLMSRKNIVF